MFKIKKIAIFIVGLYLFFCGLVYFYPLPFFYNPDNAEVSLKNAHTYGYPAQEVKYSSTDGHPLMGWITAPTSKHKMVVFMHGNSYSIEEFFYKLKPFVTAGYGTFLPEYRGFGSVKGTINQHNLEQDALSAVNYLYSQGYKNEDIIIYGMSLGTHMATYSAYNLKDKGKFDALILEVPFDSLFNVTKTVLPPVFPLSLIVKDKYDNLSMIGDINTRLLIMGGTKDATIPLHLAQNLYNHAQEPKKMIIYQGGKHSNLYNFGNDKDILEWLSAK